MYKKEFHFERIELLDSNPSKPHCCRRDKRYLVRVRMEPLSGLDAKNTCSSELAICRKIGLGFRKFFSDKEVPDRPGSQMPAVQIKSPAGPFEVVKRQAAAAYDRMMSGKARFRVVLTMG